MSDSAAHRRIMNILARGRLTGTDDTHGIQMSNVRLLHNEAKTRVERFQQYGLSSVPHNDTEVVVFFPGGSREHGIVLSVDDRGKRIRGMEAGEVALYSANGDYLLLKNGNEVVLVTKTLRLKVETEIIIDAPKVTINAPEINTTGNVTINGDLHATGSITAPEGGIGS